MLGRLRNPVCSLAACLLTAAAVGVCFLGSVNLPAETPAAIQSLGERVALEFSPTLRSARGNDYYVDVALRNTTDSPLAGPVLLVVEGTGIEGLSVENAHGEWGGLPVFRLVEANAELPGRRTTRPQRIVLTTAERLSLQQRRQFQLRYELTQGTQPSEPADQPDGRKAEAEAAKTPADEAVQHAMAVQDRWTDRLLATKGVVGTATGADEDGRAVVVVIAEQARLADDLPKTVDGVPVKVYVTGRIFARQIVAGPDRRPRAPPPADGPADSFGPQDRFERPVPIGVSTGNADRCSSGTIGCRLRGANGKTYALSNNHVYALQNQAAIGDDILQPGRVDTNCLMSLEDVIGRLSDFVPINTSGGNNVMDAAIAEVLNNSVGTATPSDGYGAPSSQPADASIFQQVKKYGRTSRLTEGIVIGVNATINVRYSNGNARFVDQIVVMGFQSGFIRAGDSGALLVTRTGNRPVGLLFAGSLGGRFAIGNPIDAVLDHFNVTIDGSAAAGSRSRPAKPVASEN